jgi:hypothetical protein
MESISNAIVKQITENGYGKVYFISDFHFPGKEEAVKKTLFRLGEKGVLLRLAHGIYLYPAKHEKMGVLYPSMDEIAKAIVTDSENLQFFKCLKDCLFCTIENSEKRHLYHLYPDDMIETIYEFINSENIFNNFNFSSCFDCVRCKIY